MTGDLNFNSTGTATSGTQTYNSNKVILKGSYWDGSQAQASGFTLINNTTANNVYKLSILDKASSEISYLTQSGDFHITGTLYAQNISGILTGSVNANQVNAGSFQNAAYTFPNNLAVTGTLTQGGSNVITQANIASNAVTSLNTQKGDLTLSAGTNISLSGTGSLTVNTVANPAFATSVTTPILQNNSADLTIKTNTSGNIILSPAGTSVNVTNADVNVDAGKKINAEGSSGDSYMTFNSAKNRMEMYVNGEMVAYFKN